MTVALRPPPPPPPAKPRAPAVLVALNVVTLAAIGGAAVWLWRAQGGSTAARAEAERAREVASKLKAAGADDQAAALYAAYLADVEADPDTRAKVAYSLGELHLEGGRYEAALRWFYEADSLGGGGLVDEIDRKVVHCLERLGRVHAAQAALKARTGLPGDPKADVVQRPDTDPVVARIGTDEIHRSEIERSLDDLPPQLRDIFQDPSQRSEYLRKYVADELLWRKAQKLEIPNDPEVRRQLEAMLRQLVVGRFVEKEVLEKITVDEADLKTYHDANRYKYDQREGARVRVLKVADADTAKRLRTQIGAGASFAELAREHSLHGKTKKNGGAIDDWVSRGDDFLGLGDPPASVLVSDGVFATKAGTVSEPVIAGGYAYLFEVLERRPGKERPFAEVRSQVEQDYRRMKLQSSYQNVIEQQLASEDVQLFPEALAAAP